MKLSYALLFLFSVATQAQKKPNILFGRVSKLNSNFKPLFRAEISTNFSDNDITNSKGEFQLSFSDIKPGTKIQITARYRNWVVVNEKELENFIPANPDVDTLKIYMCSKEQLDSSRALYYHISMQNINNRFEEKLKLLDKKAKNYQDQVFQLESERDFLKSKIGELSEYYSRINFDDISPSEKRAFKEFQKGNIQNAIKILESIDPNQNIAKAKLGIARSDSVIAEAKKNKSYYQSNLQANINILINTAKLYELQFQWDSTLSKYEKVVNADPSNFDNIFELGKLYHTLNYSNKAITAYNNALRITEDNASKGLIYYDLGGIYNTQGNYDSAEFYYLISISTFENLKHLKYEYQIHLGDAEINLAQVYINSLKIRKANLILNEIISDTSTEINFMFSKARAYNEIGQIFGNEGMLDSAFQAFSSSYKIAREILCCDSSRQLEDLIISDLNDLIANSRAIGNISAADSIANVALPIIQKQSHKYPDFNLPQQIFYYLNRGLIFEFFGGIDNALASDSISLSFCEKFSERDELSAQLWFGRLYDNIGILYHKNALLNSNEALLDSSEKYLLKSLTIREIFIARDQISYYKDYGKTLCSLCDLYMIKQGKEHNAKEKCSLANKVLSEVLKSFPQNRDLNNDLQRVRYNLTILNKIE